MGATLNQKHKAFLSCPWFKNLYTFIAEKLEKKKKKKSWKVYVMFLPEDHIKINLYITEI